MSEMRKINQHEFPYVSVVIPAYNEEDFLPNCIHSLLTQDYQGASEIIVVDNNSTDNTGSVASNYQVLTLREDRQSPACARQKGAEKAQGEIIAFIDADSRAPANWLSQIASRFIQDKQLVVLSGPYAFYDMGVLIKCMSFMGNCIGMSLDHVFRKLLRKGGALWGTNFAVRKAALVQVGGFSKDIEFYGEDYELSLRLKDEGKVGLMPFISVLTSARRLKKYGFVSTYWNWIVCYFSVLFRNRPLSRRLENAPLKLQQSWLSQFARFKAYWKIFLHGDRRKPSIALTFDDSPNEPYTSELLQILNEHKIKATFFIIGENALAFPQACLKIAANGHELANHSRSHLKWLAFNSGEIIFSELNDTHSIIKDITGFAPAFFRPPHGYWSPVMAKLAVELGYRMVLWDTMTSDWKENVVPHKIASRIVRRVRPGSIIVLHDGRGTRHGYNRVQMHTALPDIIHQLKERGYAFLTLSELLS